MADTSGKAALYVVVAYLTLQRDKGALDGADIEQMATLLEPWASGQHEPIVRSAQFFIRTLANAALTPDDLLRVARAQQLL